MPHLIIEYARCLAADDQVTSMLDAVHEAAVSTSLFRESHIRTRAIPVDHYRTAKGKEPFIHVQLRIKSGRNNMQKKSLSDIILGAIRSQHWSAGVITVEVVDMDSNSYARFTATAPVF